MGGATVALAPIGVACGYVNDVLGWHRRRRIAVATIIAVRCITFTVGNRRSRFQLTRQYRATIIGGHCCFPILLALYALWSVIGVKPGSTGLERFSMPRQLSTLSHVTSSLHCYYMNSYVTLSFTVGRPFCLMDVSQWLHNLQPKRHKRCMHMPEQLL